MAETLHQLDYANLTNKGTPLRLRPQRGLAWRISAAILSRFAWVFITIFTMGAVAGGIGALIGGVFSPFELLVAIPLIPMFAVAMRRIRRRRGLVVLGYVRQAVRLNLPLHRVLQAAIDSERGKLRKRLTDLKFALEVGMPISSALIVTIPELSSRVLGLLQFAEQSGRLDQTLNRILDEAVHRSRGREDLNPMVMWYPPVVLVVASACLWLLTVYVFPKFEMILHDFRVPTPPSLAVLNSAGDWITPVAPLLALVLLLCAAGRLREAFTARPSSELFKSFRDRVLWYLPLMHGIARDAALVDVCTLVADSIDAGFPLDDILNRAGELNMNFVMQRRLKKWTARLATGAAPGAAARDAGMPALLVQLLATTGSSPADVFRFAGRFYHSQLVRRGEILRGIYLPVVTVFLGLIVLCVALAVFQPMQLLLSHAGPNWGGP